MSVNGFSKRTSKVFDYVNSVKFLYCHGRFYWFWWGRVGFFLFSKEGVTDSFFWIRMKNWTYVTFFSLIFNVYLMTWRSYEIRKTNN